MVRILEVSTAGGVDRAAAAAADVLACNAEGSRPPLVTIRTWSREGEHLRALARALGPDQPVYSLAPPDFPTLEQYPRTTDAWVDLLLPSVRQLPSKGGLVLGGWSFGGVIALEIAERLAAEGVAIALVLMLDTRKPKARPETRPGVKMPVRLRKLARQLLEYSEIETRRERLAYARARLDPSLALAKRRDRRARRAARAERKQRRGAKRAATAAATAAAESSGTSSSSAFAPGAPPGAPAEGLIVTRWSGERMTFLERAIHVAYLKYASHPTQVPIALLRTSESRERSGDDPALGWWPLVRGPFSVDEIAGTHWTIFDPDHVEALAPRVDAILRGATSLGR